MRRLSVHVLVLVAATGSAAAQAPERPSIELEAVLSIEGLRSPPRTEQEQILADLIANTPDSETEEKSDYYFRLGELYAKQHIMWRKKSVELSATTDAKQRQQSAGAADKAKSYLLKAVKVFKALTDNDAFRNYPKLDIALFYYAYTLQSGKYMKEARAVYDKLLKNFPSSKYVPEAHLAFADYYFDAGQLADAETRYKQVLQFPKSKVYGYALYKLGWIELQLDRPERASDVFQKLDKTTAGDLYDAMSRELARVYLEQGVQTQNIEKLARAEQLYTAHVAAFPDESDAREGYATTLWTRAELETNAKLQSERWARAAEAFAPINTPEGAHSAALAWLNALAVTVPADAKLTLAKAPRSRPKPLPLKGQEAKLVAALAAYAATAPAPDDDLARMRLVVATVLRRLRHFDEAATVLDQFLGQHQDHASAELAAILLLDSLSQARRLDELLAVADAMSADTAFVDSKPELQRNLAIVRSRSRR